jgi:hypothetical protein
MFEKYMKERQNADIVQDERGFIFYRIQSNECYIVEMFVDEPFRKTKAAHELMEIVELLAVDCQCKFLTANIHLDDKGCNRALRAAFKYGFKLAQANNNIIFIVKEL